MTTTTPRPLHPGFVATYGPDSTAGASLPHSSSLPPRPGPPSPAVPPHRSGWLATLLQRWLGISDQRRDFDALGRVLEVKDQELAGVRRDLEHLAMALQRMAQPLTEATTIGRGLQDRLLFHEQRVPALAGSKKAYESAVKRERKRRQQLADDHPALSEEGRAYVFATGRLPAESPAPDVERTLSLVREAEGDTAADSP